MNKQSISVEEQEITNRFYQFAISVPLHNDEVIKEIKEYGSSRYYISNYGILYSLCNEQWKEIKLNLDRHGYYYAGIWQKGRRRIVRIHKLVSKYFVNNPDRKPIVHHLDGNRQNNYYKNLIFVTREEHIKIHKDMRRKKHETL